jgi:hypothetical protein
VNKLNSTVKSEKLQESVNIWSKEIEKLLPTNLDESAREYGALQRKRGVQSASDLLRMLLIYSTSKMSIRLLSLAACGLEISNISDTAWHKKITSSVMWLTFLLNLLLTNTIKPQSELPSKNRKIYLIDGSCFRQEGKIGNIYRAHMSYCLNTGCMKEVKVTDNHTAESLSLYTIEKDAIYLADAGYGKTTQIGYVMSREADVIFRLTPNHISFFDADKKKIDMASVLKTKQSTIDINCFIKHENKLMSVRVIASRLPEDKIEAAIKRKKRKSQKNQSKIKPETLLYAEWVIVVTSLDSSYSKEEILAIYRSRWQIELLFKRIKQNLKIHTIRPASKKYAFALIQLWLIVWAITEKQVFEFEKLLVQKNIDLQQVSNWSICSFFYSRTVFVIEAQWALLVDPFDVDLLAKHLLNHKCEKRMNQFASFILCNFSPISA